ncbi:transporter substrate-binding domain-containing protein [Promethearchaeum syntrophicum]|uniref:Transporter substrate-binding domain-containing protein n=1 Tax=Promethearchaeum syntrophicum TaxID=2594042 RepID=A0A5B9DAW7_9ARCH|nr:transporter substrate-binding domain-containing protein [Candidatus Prometheoarchaeum syntrophicum]QEE16389.1 sensory histidine kinase AtoS [Candidatus Prometheoarchaeum syntrophicum]
MNKHFTIFAVVLTMLTLNFGLIEVAESVSDQTETLKYGVDPGWPPGEFVEDGKVKGFDVDLVQLIGDYMDCEVEYYPMDWNDVLESVKNGSLDILCATDTPERREFFDFSKPILNLSNRIFVNEKVVGISNVNDLANHTVAVVKEYATHVYLEENVQDVHIVVVENVEEGLEMLVNGEVFALFDEMHIVSYYIQEHNYENLKVIGDELVFGPFCIAVKKGNSSLLEKINSEIDNIFEAGEYDRIYEKWFGTSFTSGPFSWETIIVISIIVCVLASGLGIVSLWNRTLKKRVNEKTIELKMAQNELLQSQKMEAIGQFAGGIAHDFNNVLTVILGLSNLTIDSLRDENEEINRNELIKNLEDVLRAGDRAAKLTKDVLTFSRKQVFQSQIVNLNKLLKNNKDMLARVLGENISFNLKLDQENKSIEIDPNQMSLVILNMAINSRDAMPNGGDFTIETSRTYLSKGLKGFNLKPGNYIKISLRDTGIGMDETHKQHLFEPFFTTKEKGKGTGLGLSIAFGIIKQYHGEIKVESKLGTGTVFHIYLPEIDVIDPQDDEIILKKQETLNGKETILLVEDEEMVRKFAFRVLNSHGYNCLEAKSPKEAIKISQEYHEKIDLLLSDVIMPDFSGLELKKKIEKRHPDMIILFISGYDANIISNNGELEVGINLLKKPFSSIELLERIHLLLN